MKAEFILAVMVVVPVLQSCEELDDDPEKYLVEETPVSLPLDDVASMLSELPVGKEHLKEVYNAVTSSSWNGYDEEYMMEDLFREPGAGVGDDRIGRAAMAVKSEKMSRCRVPAAAGQEYSSPLRTLIEEHILSAAASGKVFTKNDGAEVSADEYLEALRTSDIQIYWPYSENWDGEEYPVITFDPDDGSSSNIGFRLMENADGTVSAEKVIVDEEMAMKHPVWVVNRNDDCEYTSLELLRMQEPEWGDGAGEIIINPSRTVSGTYCGVYRADVEGTYSAEDDGHVKTLVLKDFTMLRNFDPWFAGASEFFVKIGAVEDFTASTEAELKLYNPAVTDFMIVVKRRQLGQPQPFNAVLVSDWSDQLTHCALMISEDDGGTRTSWKCSAVVKIKSRSYGFEIDLPVNTRDDIVWRGQLSRKYIFANDGMPGHFGDVDLTFEFVEY